VALGILHELGLITDLAENGAKAVEMVAANNYALILMDMQMPELDGLEATKQIRATGQQIPIIAMTANAFNDDRERCIEAGMDDFVAKPVVPEILFSTLLQWIPARQLPASCGQLSPVPESVAMDSIEFRMHTDLSLIEGLDLTAGLRATRNKWPAYLRLLKLFIQTHGKDDQQIAAALDAGNLAKVRELAHGLKGSAGTLGLTRVHDIAEAIELPIKLGISDATVKVRSVLKELSAALPELMAELDKIMTHSNDEVEGQFNVIFLTK
jgi:two-component system sensor histidine kinase/response regulator